MYNVLASHTLFSAVWANFSRAMRLKSMTGGLLPGPRLVTRKSSVDLVIRSVDLGPANLSARQPSTMDMFLALVTLSPDIRASRFRHRLAVSVTTMMMIVTMIVVIVTNCWKWTIIQEKSHNSRPQWICQRYNIN